MTKLWQFSQSEQIPAFSKKVQREDQRKFFKNRLKSSPRLKGQKGLWRKWQYPLNSMHWKCKNSKRFWLKHRLQKCPNGQVIAISVRSPKTLIFWKSAKGGPTKIFSKNRPKGCPRWKGPKALLRKWHYRLISMHLKCKDWNCFRRKQRLQRCSNGQVSESHPKPAFSEKKQRGHQDKLLKNRPKSTPRFKGPRALH